MGYRRYFFREGLSSNFTVSFIRSDCRGIFGDFILWCLLLGFRLIAELENIDLFDLEWLPAGVSRLLIFISLLDMALNSKQISQASITHAHWF